MATPRSPRFELICHQSLAINVKSYFWDLLEPDVELTLTLAIYTFWSSGVGELRVLVRVGGCLSACVCVCLIILGSVSNLSFLPCVCLCVCFCACVWVWLTIKNWGAAWADYELWSTPHTYKHTHTSTRRHTSMHTHTHTDTRTCLMKPCVHVHACKFMMNRCLTIKPLHLDQFW